MSREVAHRKRTRILYFLIPKEYRRKFITKSHPLQKHRRAFKISDLPNTTGVESECLIPQEIPYKNTGGDSQFLILQVTQERIQNFWSQNNTGNSEFLSPQTIQERIQNFWPPKNIRDSEFLIPQTTQKIQDFWSTNNTGRYSTGRYWTPNYKNTLVFSEFLITQTTWEKLHIFLPGLRVVKCLKIWGSWSQHMILEHYKDWLFRDINFIQSLVLHPNQYSHIKFYHRRF